MTKSNLNPSVLKISLIVAGISLGVLLLAPLAVVVGAAFSSDGMAGSGSYALTTLLYSLVADLGFLLLCGVPPLLRRWVAGESYEDEEIHRFVGASLIYGFFRVVILFQLFSGKIGSFDHSAFMEKGLVFLLVLAGLGVFMRYCISIGDWFRTA